ncbi:hypothetical protein FNV43_RR14236 [Rhamnella rubrinervis]|uniref:RING-type domain-containing protein n=1 Tax=Rhamnella rubrinervis TaxID=2594499 RepID=A0A8K0MFG1_9ROSA|nr:hypothetical protein FNV43_RR14236 [Rhamnella rubrinervis]
MGGRSSKVDSWRRNSSFRSSSSPWGSGYPPSPYVEDGQSYSAQQSFASPQYSYPPPQVYDGGHANDGTGRLKRKYSRIAENYNSFEQVTEALARAGLEASNLIVGIDFTKSNEWTGARSFNRRSLHHIGDGLNPYEQAISIIGKTLAAFDEDNLIPCFGFGDASTSDQDVFSFYPNETVCNGFEEVLGRYREIVPHLRLAGPTSFAPVIEMAMTIVEQSGGQYHVLAIIADGQVTRSVDTERGKLSPQEQKTIDAIVKASNFPLSIILVGVGDGPWDMMKEFDVDNFQFVNFTEIMLKNVTPSRKETEFALAALMEIPSQYRATIELNVLGTQKGISPQRIALPPPIYGASSVSSTEPVYAGASFFSSSKPIFGGASCFTSSKPIYGGPIYGGASSFSISKPIYGGASSFSGSKPSYSTSFEPSVPPYHVDSIHDGSAPPSPGSTYDNQLCPICLSNPKDMAFGCGHQTCCECGPDLETCPICRSPIQTRIKLY